MREFPARDLTAAVRQLVIDANLFLGDDIMKALIAAEEREESPIGKQVLRDIVANAQLAARDSIPLCQDTGISVLFVELGQDVHMSGGDVRDALNEGIRQGYRDGYLRGSMRDLVSGENTDDNTPAVIHFDIVPGDRIRIAFMAKGGGSENMSRATALTPAEGLAGIRKCVVDRVREAGGNPCPPTIVGVGIGGTIEYASTLAKKALLRPVGTPNPDPALAEFEKQTLEEINRLGIGPQGLGGRMTALAVHVLTTKHHIASIPVAVNLQCHSLRHREVEL